MLGRGYRGDGMMKRVLAVLVLMMGLVSIVEAQRYADGPIFVPVHQLIAVFDGKTLTLSDLQGNVAQTIPVFDTNSVRTGLVYLYWSPTGGRFAVIAQAADLTDPFEKENSILEIWQFSKDGLIDLKRLYTEKSLIPYTVGANFAWLGANDFLVVKTAELPRNDSVYRYTISNDTVTFNSEIFADVFIDHISVSDSSRYLLSVINDQKIKIWDLQQNTLIGTTSDSVQIDSPPVFSPNSHEFVFVNPLKPDEIQIWNTNAVMLTHRFTVDSDVWGLEWGQGGIITIHYDGRIGITNPVSMHTHYPVSGLGEVDNFISWDETKTNFVMSSQVGGIQIRSGITGEIICFLLLPNAVEQNESIGPGCAADLVAVAGAMGEQN